MRVVDMKVDRRPARAVGVGNPARPVRPRDHPRKMGRLELPEPARLDGVEGEREFGEERQDVGHHDHAAIGPPCGKDGVGLVHRQGNGLLNKHMLARFQGTNRQRCVLVARHAKVNQIHRRVGQQVRHVPVSCQPRKVHHRPLGAEIALDRGPVAGKLAQGRGYTGR